MSTNNSLVSTLFDLAEENAQFVGLGVQFIKPEEWVGESFRGVFLGCVHLPAAASRLDLGDFDVALYATERGLLADVLRTTTRAMPWVPVLSLVHWRNDGKRGRTWDIRASYDRNTDPENVNAILKALNVPWTGSAAEFFGNGGDETDKDGKPRPKPYDLVNTLASIAGDESADAFIEAAMARKNGESVERSGTTPDKATSA